MPNARQYFEQHMEQLLDQFARVYPDMSDKEFLRETARIARNYMDNVRKENRGN